MKTIKTMTHRIMAGSLFALVAMAGTQATAADVTAGVDVNSAYVWRGITFNDSFVAQPSVDVAHDSGLGFNVWGNYDLDDYTAGGTTIVESGEFSEIDLTLSYAVPVEGVDLSVGIIEYLFPEAGADANTREVYAAAGVDVGGVSVGGFVAYDFDALDDIYANVSAAYGCDVSEELSVELSGLIGFAGDDFAIAYGGTDSGAHEWQVSLSGAYAVSDATELGAFVTYSDNVDDDVLIDAAADVDVFGGVSLYYSF